MPHSTPLHLMRPAGFTLMEVLIAIAIFGVGMVAVSTIFPVAISLQKQTITQIESEQVSRNAKAVFDVQINGISASTDLGSPPLDTVVKIPAALLNARFPLAMRTYQVDHHPSAKDADYFWVPLMMHTTAGDWQGFIFVVHRNSNATYTSHGSSTATANPNDDTVTNQVPLVELFTIANANGSTFRLLGIPDASAVVSVGNALLDNAGSTYRVTEINGATITTNGFISASATGMWLAPKPITGSDGPGISIVNTEFTPAP